MDFSEKIIDKKEEILDEFEELTLKEIAVKIKQASKSIMTTNKTIRIYFHIHVLELQRGGASGGGEDLWAPWRRVSYDAGPRIIRPRFLLRGCLAHSCIHDGIMSVMARV